MHLYEDALLSLGVSAITLEDNADQPLFEPDLNEPPLWSQTRLTALVDAELDRTALLSGLEAILNTPAEKHTVEIVEDKDWEREWMDNYHPLQISESFWVCPSWKTRPDSNAINLMLDPGLAFGTGTHPTTQLCLKWLSKQPLKGKSLIDYGCGSGILAIGGLLLGCSSAIGVDNDPQALIASRQNMQLNHIETDRLQLTLPDQAEIAQSDLIIANILAQPLLELACHLQSILKPGGQLALSGILNSQTAAIVERYSTWFSALEIETEQEWALITGIRKQY